MLSGSSTSSFTRDVELLYPNNNAFSSEPSHHSMNKSHNSLDIILSSDTVFLRGTGSDTEPATLQGDVVLHLAEATPFKEIILQLRGKSRVPHFLGNSPSVLGGNYQKSILYTHDWSFLHGDRKHVPTLKAGRHVFPFCLRLDGALPSSLSYDNGLAAIYYKLRATAVRSVFAANLHTSAPVRLIRSFTPEALEYQQTLEVENTWPGKLMYSIMVPHKAWAAGDIVTALVKFSPLNKGVRINIVTTTIQEHFKAFTKTGASHDDTRVVAFAKHEICNNRIVTFPLSDWGENSTLGATLARSNPRFPMMLSSSDGTSSLAPERLLSPQLPEAHPLSHSASAMSGSPTHPPPEEGSIRGAQALNSASRMNSQSPPFYVGDEEILATLALPLPVNTTPSHPVEPIVVSHRIRWSIFMSNPDGHTSELRCSLPLHVLDHVLLPEALRATAPTRRMLLGLEDAQSHCEEIELPSYPAHVLDRVANAYMPAASAHGPGRPPFGAPGMQTTFPPRAPADSLALEWVNAELHRQRGPNYAVTPTESTQTSRHTSRAPSPERNIPTQRRQIPHHNSIFSLRPLAKVPHTTTTTTTTTTTMRSHAVDSGNAPSLQAPPCAEHPYVDPGLSRVPDYDVASRGFLGGGVTPLWSTHGLPSYEVASERSPSERDLAARFAAVPAGVESRQG